MTTITTATGAVSGTYAGTSFTAATPASGASVNGLVSV